MRRSRKAEHDRWSVAARESTLDCRWHSAAFPTVTFDHPFAGALVPAEYYKRDTRVRSIMVEVNRGLYMDEATGEKLPSFDETARPVPQTVRRLASA
jgi:N-formylglutamate amidohydrolase